MVGCEAVKDLKETISSIFNKPDSKIIEYEITVCHSNNKFIAGDICRGGAGYVRPSLKKCPEGSKRVGTIHTHPFRAYELSENDIINSALFGDKFICIAIPEDRKTLCVDVDKLKPDVREKLRRIAKLEGKRVAEAIKKSLGKPYEPYEHLEKEIEKIAKEIRGNINKNLKVCNVNL